MVQDNNNVILLQTGHLNRFFRKKKPQKLINLKLLSIKSNFLLHINNFSTRKIAAHID